MLTMYMLCSLCIYYNVRDKKIPKFAVILNQASPLIPQKVALPSSKFVIHFLKEKLLFCIKKITSPVLPLSVFVSHYVSRQKSLFRSFVNGN